MLVTLLKETFGVKGMKEASRATVSEFMRASAKRAGHDDATDGPIKNMFDFSREELLERFPQLRVRGVQDTPMAAKAPAASPRNPMVQKAMEARAGKPQGGG
jgi:hypothetical protein